MAAALLQDTEHGGAHWIVCVSDSGIPLFSWSQGMPVPARVLWNIVTGVAAAATTAEFSLRRISCTHSTLLVDTCAQEGADTEYTIAALLSKPDSCFTSRAGPQPEDMRRLYQLLGMMAGDRALRSLSADRLKGVLRVRACVVAQFTSPLRFNPALCLMCLRCTLYQRFIYCRLAVAPC